MVGPTVPPQIPPIPPTQRSQMTPAQLQQQQLYIDTLFKILIPYAASSAELHARMQGMLKASTPPTTQDFKDIIAIIEALCACKAVVEILNCLCKFLTGG